MGPTGRVIGVDMTAEMVAKARANAKKGGYTQVEFRLGEIEALPVADGIVDVIISNCVINLCPDKRPVYREAFRVLKPGGRIAVSDVVAGGELPDDVKRDLALHSGCLAGATSCAGDAGPVLPFRIRPAGAGDRGASAELRLCRGEGIGNFREGGSGWRNALLRARAAP